MNYNDVRNIPLDRAIVLMRASNVIRSEEALLETRINSYPYMGKEDQKKFKNSLVKNARIKIETVKTEDAINIIERMLNG